MMNPERLLHLLDIAHTDRSMKMLLIEYIICLRVSNESLALIANDREKRTKPVMNSIKKIEDRIHEIEIPVIQKSTLLMKTETDFIQSILPSHYTCEARVYGVHCYSDKGINEVTEEYLWEEFKQKVRDEFGERLQEFVHQVCTHHSKFTVFLTRM